MPVAGKAFEETWVEVERPPVRRKQVRKRLQTLPAAALDGREVLLPPRNLAPEQGPGRRGGGRSGPYRTRSHAPLFSDRKIASITCMFASESDGGVGTAPPSRTAREKASS